MDARAGRLRGLFLIYRILPPREFIVGDRPFLVPIELPRFAEGGRERPLPILAQEVIGCLPKLSLMRIRAEALGEPIQAEEQVKMTAKDRPRPRRPREDKHDASLRATAAVTPSSEPRSGSAPPGRPIGSDCAHDGGRGPRSRRSIRACSWPPVTLLRPTRPRRPTWPTASRRSCSPTSLRTSSPASPWPIVSHGQVALAQGYGLSNVATGSPVQADTRFDIGSVTKTFTALGVLLLYQESQGTSHPLDLNAPISHYLHNTKSFKLPPRWSRYHHDGAARHDQRHQGCGRTPGPGRPSSSRSRTLPSSTLPGRRPRTATRTTTCSASSSSSGPEKSTAPSSRIRSCDRSGCPRRRSWAGPPTVPNQAVGYDAPRHGRWRKAKVQNGPAMYAAAGMVSTAQDMATYMTALLSGRILDPATYELDVDLDSDAAIRGESPLSVQPRPGMGYGDRHERRAHRGRQGRVRSPDTTPSSSSTPPRTAESSSPSTPIITAVGMPSSVTALQVAESVYAATQTGSLPGG